MSNKHTDSIQTLNDFVTEIFIFYELSTVTWKRENFMFPEKELLLEHTKNITLVNKIPANCSYYSITEYNIKDAHFSYKLFLIQH